MPRIRASASISFLIFCFSFIHSSAQTPGDLWLMKAHDARRTGQSRSNGPREVDPNQSWSVEAPAAFVLNIGASVSDRGVFFGSWGLIRLDPLGRNSHFWDKYDGQIFGYDLDGQPLWNDGALDLDFTPYVYDFGDRQDQLNAHNGTVEGQAAIDTARNVMYVGRGDGKLYAIDPDAGTILWRFTAFNPQLPDDPDGGGEVVSAPLLGADGTIYFGSWGVGPYETNAFYALNPDGSLQWRFPADSSLTQRPVFTSPALSPDGETIYFGTWFNDADITAHLFALNSQPTGPASDDARRRWSLDLHNGNLNVWTTTLAVGSDGTVFVGGLQIESNKITNTPLVFAISENENGEPQYKWPHQYVALRDGAQWVGGIALRETEGVTRRLYAVTSNFRNANDKEEGELYALDPATGSIISHYDPSDDVPAAVGGLNSPAIGADGTIYFGVRGKYQQLFVNAVNGHVFAVQFDEATSDFHKFWNFEVAGHIEWNHTAIGPDGGIYVASSVGGPAPIFPFQPDEIPSNTTCTFYAIKGPSNPVAVEETPSQPNNFDLAQNYPNPFNPETTIRFNAARRAEISLGIYNALGQRVRTLVSGQLFETGSHQVVWDGRDDAGRTLPTGVYFLRLVVDNGGLTKTRKLLLLK